MKNKVCIVVVITIALMVAQFGMLISSVKAEIITGSTGSEGDVSWSFDTETGTVTFSGSGAIYSSWDDRIQEKNVVSIIINAGITSMDSSAFENCYNLTSITVDIENENYSSENGILFNKDKTKIIRYSPGKSDSSYTIPNSVTTIDFGAFECCNNLTSITIPNSVTYIYRDAFRYCNNLTSVTIPNSVTSIGDWAFDGCNNLTNITVDIENENYSSENGILFNKDKTELICFLSAKSDSSYTIPNSVTSIGSYAFSGCDNLTSITIPNSVTSIGIYAFRNCDNLTIYCKSNSTALEYAVDKEITYQTDDNVPRIISLIQKGAYIKVEATDDGVGLDNKAYSIDGKNWYENNSIAIDESKTYTVYVKDKLGNIATKDIQIDITQPEITNISVEGHTIKVTATDNVALADKPYSIDGTNYQSSNEFTVMKEGTYTIYVKDAQGNVATKSALVTKVNDGDHDINDKDNENDDKSHNTNQDESENKDTTAPNITNISVEGYTIEVTATDNVGLADKAYSLDKENWQSSNEIVVTKTGRYMVYVKDKSGNIANKLVVVGDEKKGSNNSNKSELIAQQDNSQSKNKLPQTGNMSTVIICAIVIICIVCIIIFKRIKRMRF